MKTVILAGGLGTRISEESYLKPKPMIEIGGKPIIWHIMKLYSHYNFNEFIICCGYKGDVIKKWFSDYYLHTSDVTFDFVTGNNMTVHNNFSEPWKVTLVDTGLNTMTGGRIKRIQQYIGNETFFLTYGDGVSNVNIEKLIEFHKRNNKIATLTTVNIGQRFGVLEIENEKVKSFREKDSFIDCSMINAGFMVMEPKIFEFIENDDTVFEQQPLNAVAKDGELMAYKHENFWQCMDTQRDKLKLESLWESGEAPWKVWT